MFTSKQTLIYRTVRSGWQILSIFDHTCPTRYPYVYQDLSRVFTRGWNSRDIYLQRHRWTSYNATSKIIWYRCCANSSDVARLRPIALATRVVRYLSQWIQGCTCKPYKYLLRAAIESAVRKAESQFLSHCPNRAVRLLDYFCSSVVYVCIVIRKSRVGGFLLNFSVRN